MSTEYSWGSPQNDELFHWDVVFAQYQTILSLPAESSEQRKLFSSLRRAIISEGDMLWKHARTHVDLEACPHGFIALLLRCSDWDVQVSMLQNLPLVHIQHHLENQVDADVYKHAKEDISGIGNTKRFSSTRLSSDETFTWLMNQYGPVKNKKTQSRSSADDFEWFARHYLSDQKKFPDVEKEKAIWNHWYQSTSWKQESFTEGKNFKKYAQKLSLVEGSFPEDLTWDDFPQTFWFQLMENSKWYFSANFLRTASEKYAFKHLENLKGFSQFRKERDINFLLSNPNMSEYPKEWLHVLTL